MTLLAGLLTVFFFGGGGPDRYMWSETVTGMDWSKILLLNQFNNKVMRNNCKDYGDVIWSVTLFWLLEWTVVMLDSQRSDVNTERYLRPTLKTIILTGFIQIKTTVNNYKQIIASLNCFIFIYNNYISCYIFSGYNAMSTYLLKMVKYNIFIVVFSIDEYI